MLEEIKTIAQLQAIIGDEMMAKIEAAAYHDPDWIIDMVKELEYITPSIAWYIPDFHGKLQAAGYTSDAAIDCRKILTEIEAKENKASLEVESEPNN